jgi:hypothetical protein
MFDAFTRMQVGLLCRNVIDTFALDIPKKEIGGWLTEEKV